MPKWTMEQVDTVCDLISAGYKIMGDGICKGDFWSTNVDGELTGCGLGALAVTLLDPEELKTLRRNAKELGPNQSFDEFYHRNKLLVGYTVIEDRLPLLFEDSDEILSMLFSEEVGMELSCFYQRFDYVYGNTILDQDILDAYTFLSACALRSLQRAKKEGLEFN